LLSASSAFASGEAVVISAAEIESNSASFIAARIKGAGHK
jgi:hypothetical protein